MEVGDDGDSRACSVPGELSLFVYTLSTSLSENHVKFMSWQEREADGSTDRRPKTSHVLVGGAFLAGWRGADREQERMHLLMTES